MISKERIVELQKIIKEDYGEELSYEKAAEAGRNLVGFFEVLLQIENRTKNKNGW